MYSTLAIRPNASTIKQVTVLGTRSSYRQGAFEIEGHKSLYPMKMDVYGNQTICVFPLLSFQAYIKTTNQQREQQHSGALLNNPL